MLNVLEKFIKADMLFVKVLGFFNFHSIQNRNLNALEKDLSINL